MGPASAVSQSVIQSFGHSVPGKIVPARPLKAQLRTMNRMVALLVAAIIAVTATHAEEELVAVVHLTSFSSRNVTGNLKIVQTPLNGPVTITGKISGLTEGPHGFHVHEKGNLSEGCKSTGAHFNPENNTHGAPEDTVRHVGDLGNIMANSEGEAIINITDNIISLRGSNSIVGRSIVVHSDEDDLGKGNHSLSLTTGNSGDRWACGIIGIESSYGKWNSGSFTMPSVSILVIFFLIAVHQHLKF
ncbi:superoxide dismutase [Cu-Zn], chloroplastic isoform X1 [Mycetomoellerius zeteki]|uniref:superoxide dismutase [Cu-Zn], chloroplastic isoform X1 n=2 Tax=Mycetomoellerius zeteki TaxID=64791 RepID=UPI00084EA00D|nr:PREDICTED: superoxide dismutase [Cu-Zn], chloroplastic-like isoform X1 [Trachymyrmex zeteki]